MVQSTTLNQCSLLGRMVKTALVAVLVFFALVGIAMATTTKTEVYTRDVLPATTTPDELPDALEKHTGSKCEPTPRLIHEPNHNKPTEQKWPTLL